MDELFSGVDWDKTDLVTFENTWKTDLEKIVEKNSRALEEMKEKEKTLLRYTKDAKEELAALETTLKKYTDELHETDLEIKKILDISRTLDTQSRNMHLLLAEVQTIIDALALDKEIPGYLQTGDFFDTDAVRKLTDYTDTLNTKIKQSFPMEIKNTAIYKERTVFFSKTRELFAERLGIHLAEYLRAKKPFAGWMEPDQSTFSELLRWSRLFEFLKENFPKKHLGVIAEYGEKLSVLYKNDFACVTQYLLAKGLEQPAESTTAAMLLFKNEPERIETPTARFGDALDLLLLNIAACMAAEREIVATLLYGIDLSSIDSRASRKINGTLETIFAPLQPILAAFLAESSRKSGITTAEALIITDCRSSEARSSSVLFFVRILRALGDTAQDLFNAFIAAQTATIKPPTAKKRTEGLIDYVVRFHTLVSNTETIVKKTLEKLEKKNRKNKCKTEPKINAVKPIAEGYMLLADAIRASFDDLEKNASSEKEKENTKIVLMQNTHFLGTLQTDMLASFVAEMHETFARYMSLYLRSSMKTIYGSLYTFFVELTQRMEIALAEDEDPAEMAFFPKFSKPVAEKEIGAVTKKTIEKSTVAVSARIEKHFKTTNEVLEIVLQKTQEKAVETLQMFAKCIDVVYKNTLATQFQFSDDDIRRCFNAQK
ncbi:MAG: exocyst complex component Sec3 [Amphiamblys sp. WSBS2006]|nr:MAG: exocyst complex component Sec3 [Amphiamblys sp. WSBS2006]